MIVRRRLLSMAAKLLLISGIILFIFGAAAQAQIQKAINYQGFLTDSGGLPLSGTLTFEISIMDGPTIPSAQLIFAESHQDVQVVDGVYNIDIGTGTRIWGRFDEQIFDEARWLSIIVNGEELLPFQPFRFVALALRSTVAETCLSICNDGDFIGCYEGPSGTAGVGSCQTGQRICSAGQFGSCVGQVTPSTEACNSIDDDCNNVIDDALPGASGCTVFYIDEDGDGYGADSDSGICLCNGDTGYASLQGDCNDYDPDVHSGSTNFFTTPLLRTGGYDYNCNGVNDKQYTQTASTCTLNIGYCSGSGWLGGIIPDCGETGSYQKCTYNYPDCITEYLSYTQGCR